MTSDMKAQLDQYKMELKETKYKIMDWTNQTHDMNE
jgi:hypothetical protein